MDNSHKKNQDLGCLLGIDNNEDLSPRRKFRFLLFHVLYACDALEYSVDPFAVAEGFNREYHAGIDLTGETIIFVRGISREYKNFETLLLPHLENWKIERIGKCTLLTIYIALWEMLYTTTPHRIIINEAIELAKAFSEKDAYKFVNGLLDKISHQLQPDQPAREINSEDADSANTDSVNADSSATDSLDTTLIEVVKIKNYNSDEDIIDEEEDDELSSDFDEEDSEEN